MLTSPINVKRHHEIKEFLLISQYVKTILSNTFIN